MLSSLYVAFGSAIGGVARWLIGGWLQGRAGGAAPGAFPVGTLAVNASGSFLLGILAAVVLRGAGDRESASWLLLGVGFCGGYTTFSAFSLETVALAESRGWGLALTNVVASSLLGIAGVVAGLATGRLLLGRTG